jgi:hypothetical protein
VYSSPGGGTTYDSWSWSPDGRRAIGLSPNSLVLRDSTDPTSTPIRGTEWQHGPSSGGQESFIGWSPRGTYFTWLGEGARPGQWSVFVGTPDDPRRNTLPSLGDGSFWSSTHWSADETRAIISTDETHARLMNGDGSPLPGALQFDDTNFLGLSNDGSRLLFLAPRGSGTPPLPSESTSRLATACRPRRL